MSTLAIVDKHYEEVFCTMVINPADKAKILAAARLILVWRKTYERIAAAVNPKMPWYFVGILHYRESTCNMTKHLHNGDSLKMRTYRQPAGRPSAPPAAGFPKGYTFFESAYDALRMPSQNFHLETEWTLNRMLYRFEKWNGLGYLKLSKKHPEESITNPYLWSRTNQYTTGKFSSDCHYDHSLKDEQIGAAPLLRFLTDRTLGLV